MKLFAIFRALRPIAYPTPTGITPRAARTRDRRTGEFTHRMSREDEAVLLAAARKDRRRQLRNLDLHARGALGMVS